MLFFASKVIQKQEDLTTFSRFFDRPGCRGALDMEWLQNNRAYGIYAKDKLIGGIVMESFPYARALEGVANVELQKLFLQLGGKQNGVAFNAFWLDKTIQDPRLRLSGWIMIARIGLEIWLARKAKFILFRTTSAKLVSLYTEIGVGTPIGCPSQKDGKLISAFMVKATLANFFKLLRFVVVHGLSKGTKTQVQTANPDHSPHAEGALSRSR